MILDQQLLQTGVVGIISYISMFENSKMGIFMRGKNLIPSLDQ